jgi:hypothetical protein
MVTRPNGLSSARDSLATVADQRLRRGRTWLVAPVTLAPRFDRASCAQAAVPQSSGLEGCGCFGGEGPGE